MIESRVRLSHLAPAELDNKGATAVGGKSDVVVVGGGLRNDSELQYRTETEIGWCILNSIGVPGFHNGRGGESI